MSASNIHRPTPRFLYPSLIVAAIAITVFSLLGIASITGHLPGALAGQPASAEVAAAQAAPCAECGVVEAVRAIQTRGSGTGFGAVLGGLGGAVLGNTLGRGNGRTAMTIIGGGAGAYAGNEIEKNGNRHTLWQTRVRMDDGTLRTLTTQFQPEFGVGSKVKLVDGQMVPRA